MDLSDLLRIMTISLGTAVAALTWYIVLTFRRRLRYDQKSQLMTTYAQAVSSHIIPTAVGISILIAASVAEMFGRFGLPLSWRSPVYAIGFALLTFSLYRFARHQMGMLQASRNFYEGGRR